MKISLGPDAGTGAAASFVGTDDCGSVSVTIGSSPGTGGGIFTLTPSLLGYFLLTGTGSENKSLKLFPANANAISADVGINGGNLVFAHTVLTAGETYQWAYRVD